MFSFKRIQSSLSGTLFYWWIIEMGCEGVAVHCPSPGNQDGGNMTSLDGQATVRLISCTRGCCPGSADGCCYRTTDDVVVYSVPISVCTVLCAITIGFVYRHVRTKRINRVNQARLQASVDKPELPLSPDNPPSYMSCVVERVPSTTNLTVHDVDDVIEVVIHATAKDVEDDMPLSPPPVYDDVFKSGDEDQVAVISPRGHVSFVDHNLLPPSVPFPGGRDGCARPGWHSPRTCHVAVNDDHAANNCPTYCPNPIVRSPHLTHLKETEGDSSSPSSRRSLRPCHVKVTEDHDSDNCHNSSASSRDGLRLCQIKVTNDYGVDDDVKMRPNIYSNTNSNPAVTIKDCQSRGNLGRDHVNDSFHHVTDVQGIDDHEVEISSKIIHEGDDVKVSCIDNESYLMTSGDDVLSVGVMNEACLDISCGR